MLRNLLARWVRACSKIFCEELAHQYPATLFGNRLDVAPNRQELTELDSFLLESLRNKHLGKRCFIVCNGPSLRPEDLDRLKFEYTFASNKIYLIFKQTKWRPTYYSCEDSLVIQQNVDSIRDINQSLKIFPSNILDHIDRPKGWYFCKFIFHPELLKTPPSRERHFSYDLTHGVHWGGTITYTLLQLAVFMGFKDIYLIGLDHRYTLPTKRQKGWYIADGEQNHFSKDYRIDGEKWHPPLLPVLERSYEYAREATELLGISIYNASRETALDVFTKVDFDTII